MDVDGCFLLSSTNAVFSFATLIAGVAKHRQLALFALAGLLIGICLASGYGASMHARAGLFADGPSCEVTLELLEDSTAGYAGERALVLVTNGRFSGAVALASFPGADELRFGSVLHAKCSFAPLKPTEGERAWQNGAQCSARVTDICEQGRNDVRGAILRARNSAIDAIGCEDDAHALIQAIVCGYRRNVRDTETYAAFQTCGLAHLVAVSGAHLVIVCGFVASLLRALRVARPLSSVILINLMMSYLILSGMPVSALRAVAMSSLNLFAFMGKRRSSAMNALGIAAIAILCSNPSASVSASFALSALSTAGIVVFAPLFSHIAKQLPVMRMPALGDPLAITAAAGLLSQPYACSLFAQLPLISPLANIAAAPLFPASCALGLVGALTAPIGGPLAHACGFASALAAGALDALVTVLARIPFACVPVSISGMEALILSAVAASALWMLWPCDVRKAARAALPVMAAALLASGLSAAFHLSQDRIVMLDVGQGDSFLVESRGATLLVDTGNQDTRLLEQLGSLGIAHIDSVLLTHADDDHCGSLDAIARAVDVDRILVAKGMVECDNEPCTSLTEQAHKAAREIAPLAYGNAFSVGAFTAHVIWPHTFHDGENADSLCLRLEFDPDADGTSDFTSLFTGDAESEQLDEMISASDIGDIDLLKVGHHGSRDSLSPEQARTLRPEIALIGVGRDNRYGHPTQETLDTLNSIGCQVCRSDENGQVEIRMGQGGQVQLSQKTRR